MTRSPLALASMATLVFMFPSVCAADGKAAESSSIQLEPDWHSLVEDRCDNLPEWITVAGCTPDGLAHASSITDPAWARFELDALRRERNGVRVVGPSFGIAFSVLGLAAGAWLLAIGVEGARGPIESCGHVEVWRCFGRPAPYAGSVLMGLSAFGMARSGKWTRERAKRRRHLSRQISELTRR